MGSVSSLVTGNSLNSLNGKHCKASGESRLKKESSHQRKSGGCSLDELLKCSFSHNSSSSHPSKGLSHSRSGRNEDFFYIKVSQKPRSAQHRGAAMEENEGNRDDSDRGTQPKLLYMTKKMTERTSTEQPLVRAFTPVISRNTTSLETSHKSLGHIFGLKEKTRSPDITPKPENLSGTLSDSGRNSMSSLPTHSTSDSLTASTGPVTRRDSSSPAAHIQGKGLHPSFPSWLNENNANLDRSYSPALSSSVSKANGNTNGSLRSVDKLSPLSETTGGIRSPITADDSLIEHLEHRLLERESELQWLQVSCEEKEADACQRFEERQRHCADEIEGLKQQCSTKLQQVSHITTKTQQALQLQVSQLQEEKQRLEEDVLRLTQEKDLAELRLQVLETHSTALSPTLEETQWEVCQKTGEIFLLKQQLKDSQADVSHKLNEIISLRALLKEVTAKMEVLEQQSRDHEDKLHSRTIEAEVCQNELQRKKNEADLLREKVCKLEKEIEAMKWDLSVAKEQGIPHQPEAPAQTEALEGLTHSSDSAAEVCRETDTMTTQSLQKEVDTLRQQLRHEREAKERLADSFEQERQTWNKEKDKVIKYQKQLQINYLQMHKKNQDLERILKELTAELEARTELGTSIPYNSGLQTYDDVIATEI